MKKKIINCGSGIAGCKYLHVRCIAQIVNLIVSDGLKEVNASIKWVKAAVKYIRSSLVRMKKFREFVDSLEIKCKMFLKLDVAIRWNSTHEILNVAEKYEKVFDSFGSYDPYFKLEVQSSDDGLNFMDWNYVRKMIVMLQQFYDATVHVNGTSYVTSNTFWT